MVPLVYLKTELGFTMGEWQALSQVDKDTLKEWARIEMAELGIA